MCEHECTGSALQPQVCQLRNSPQHRSGDTCSANWNITERERENNPAVIALELSSLRDVNTYMGRADAYIDASKNTLY